MEFFVDPQSGRSVIASRDYDIGEVLFQEQAYVMSAIVPVAAGGNKKKHSGGGGAAAAAGGDIRRCLYCFVQIDVKKHSQAVPCAWVQSAEAAATPNVPAVALPLQLLRLSEHEVPVPQPVLGIDGVPVYPNAVHGAAAGGDEAARAPIPRSCGGQYCSAACYEAHHVAHETLGECTVLEATNSIRHRVPHEDFNTLQVVALAVARAEASGGALQLRLSNPLPPSPHDDHNKSSSSYTVETVGLGLETPLTTFEDLFHHLQSSLQNFPSLNNVGSSSAKHPLPSDFVPWNPAYRVGSFGAMQHLVTNRTWMDAEIRSDYEALYDTYEALRTRTQSQHHRPSTLHKYYQRDEKMTASPASNTVQELPATEESNQQKTVPPAEQSDTAAITCTGCSVSSTKQQQQCHPGSKPRRATSSPLAYVSRDVFVSLCCAFQANGFGLWGPNAQGLAAGFFPLSSFFNHSCAPNVARHATGRFATFFAVRPIRKGEGIFLSYIDFKLCREQRQAKLLATYSFLCGCARCSDEDGDTVRRSLYDVPMCGDCKAKVLRPVKVQNDAKPVYVGVCPCCNGIETDWSL